MRRHAKTSLVVLATVAALAWPAWQAREMRRRDLERTAQVEDAIKALKATTKNLSLFSEENRFLIEQNQERIHDLELAATDREAIKNAGREWVRRMRIKYPDIDWEPYLPIAEPVPRLGDNGGDDGGR